MTQQSDLTPEELTTFRRWAAELRQHVEEELGRFGLLEKIRLVYNDIPYGDAAFVRMYDVEGRRLCDIAKPDVPSHELAHFLFGLLGRDYAPDGFEVTEIGFGDHFFRLGVRASALLFPERGVVTPNLPPPVKG